jgi:hypothetical protein
MELRRGQRWMPDDGGPPREIYNVEEHADLVEWASKIRPGGSSSRIAAFRAWIKRTHAVCLSGDENA